MIGKKLFALSLFLAGSGAAHAADCPAERAVYTLNQPGFTAGFVPTLHMATASSNLYFFVTSPRQTYWFAMNVSQGYANLYLSPITDPYLDADGPGAVGNEDVQELALYQMSNDWDVTLDPPNAGDPAPDRLFAPELGTVLWYVPDALSTTKSSEREVMERGVFSLSECLAEPRKPAYP